jgi:hypothetical protein
MFEQVTLFQARNADALVRRVGYLLRIGDKIDLPGRGTERDGNALPYLRN